MFCSHVLAMWCNARRDQQFAARRELAWREGKPCPGGSERREVAVEAGGRRRLPANKGGWWAPHHFVQSIPTTLDQGDHRGLSPPLDTAFRVRSPPPNPSLMLAHRGSKSAVPSDGIVAIVTTDSSRYRRFCSGQVYMTRKKGLLLHPSAYSHEDRCSTFGPSKEH